MSLGPLYAFLGEVSVQVLCPFFNWVVCLPGVESCEFFIYFGDQALVSGIIGKYVFPYCWFSFYFNAVTSCFSIDAFKILSLSWNFAILIMICLAVGLFGFLFLGILCVSWIMRPFLSSN